ncbi:MAG: hypothetical protein JWM25_33, partial [Thermoleophilia bacterium]|nr:hypothetical protein [Thermoleophilia bacterium]
MPLDQTLTKPELVLDMLESMRDVLLGTSPLAAEVEVSLGTIGWFLTAPDFARGSFDDHPVGRCAAMPSMRLLSEEIDTFPEHDDVALALNRVLASLQPNEPELRDAARANELILLDRGAQAPEWTTQLDRWELTEAWQLSEAAPTGLGARLASVLGWRHPCGEEHCLIVDSDPRSYDHIEAIGSFDSTREVVAQIRSELA